MTERDLARVEQKLGVKLPAHYRKFLLEHGVEIARAKRKGGFVPFFTTAKEIIDANAELRANPALRDTNEDTEPWPLKYLIVGTNGGGDDWCVDLSNRRETIWFFDSEAHGTFRRADQPTWAAYLKELRSPRPAETAVIRSYLCKKGKLAKEAEGDGSFSLRDAKGRDWVCYEQRERTQEEILALVRGELRTPDWLGEKGLQHLGAASVEGLRDALAKQR
ncbi:MAG TPA: SMI1/KNR4 family protein [Gemmata sp.]|nr:SMI1/KNR4 family protein [Gemmata sp.]